MNEKSKAAPYFTTNDVYIKFKWYTVVELCLFNSILGIRAIFANWS